MRSAHRSMIVCMLVQCYTKSLEQRLSEQAKAHVIKLVLIATCEHDIIHSGLRQLNTYRKIGQLWLNIKLSCTRYFSLLHTNFGVPIT